MYKKFIKKLLVFSIIFMIITPILGRFLLGGKNQILDGFYYEEENTLDVLFFGSSHSYTGIIPYEIWNKTGITSYNLGQPEQQIWNTYYYIKEALKYQKPKAVFVDVYTVTYDVEYMPIENNNINYDTMRMSINKLQAINNSVNFNERPYFIFDLMKNKSIWKNIAKNNFIDNFTNKEHENKGYWEWFETYKNETPAYGNIDEIGKIPKKTEEYLYKIIDLLEKENIPLVFIKTPVKATEEHEKRYNRVEQIAKENNIDFINFNEMYDEIGIDFESDFIDEGKHLNFKGAKKVSNYISNYIVDKFDIKDKSKDLKYRSWVDGYNVWKHKEDAYYINQEKNLTEYKERIEKSNYLVVLTYNNDENHIAIVNGGNLIQHKYGKFTFEINSNIENIEVNTSFKGDKPSIIINNEEYIKSNNKLNIVIYDKVLNRVIDNRGIDI